MSAETPLVRRQTTTAAPLARRPKQLDGEPTLFEPVPTGQGAVALRSVKTGDGRNPTRPSGTAPGMTDESASLVDVPAEPTPIDPVVRAKVRQIAARLAVPRPRLDPTVRRGPGELASVPYRGGSDDIDLDATMAVLAERPVPEETDIIVRERVRTRRSVVLVVDVSGSMRGERVRNAAATVGAVASELASHDLGVLAFWSDAAVLLRIGQAVRPVELVDTLLELPARGLTNVAFPLQVAARELSRAPARDARVLLLSDCVHNAGPDPRPEAARLPRLDVLLDVTGEHDLDLGRSMARTGRGGLFRIRQHRDVAPALGRVFAA